MALGIFDLPNLDYASKILHIKIILYLCTVRKSDGGAKQAEIIPFEPDTGNAGVGKSKKISF